MTSEPFKEKLKELVAQSGLKKQVIAMRAGMNPSTLSMMLTTGKLPSTERLLSLAKVLGVTSDELLCTPEQPRNAYETYCQALRLVQQDVSNWTREQRIELAGELLK